MHRDSSGILILITFLSALVVPGAQIGLFMTLTLAGDGTISFVLIHMQILCVRGKSLRLTLF